MASSGRDQFRNTSGLKIGKGFYFKLDILRQFGSEMKSMNIKKNINEMVGWIFHTLYLLRFSPLH